MTGLQNTLSMLFLIGSASASIFDPVKVKFDISLIIALLVALTAFAIVCAFIMEMYRGGKEEDEDNEKED